MTVYLFAECVHVVAVPGTYVVRQALGSQEPCGIYIAGYFNETIIVDISKVDVTSQDNGVVAVSSSMKLKFCILLIDFYYYSYVLKERPYMFHFFLKI